MRQIIKQMFVNMAKNRKAAESGEGRAASGSAADALPPGFRCACFRLLFFAVRFVWRVLDRAAKRRARFSQAPAKVPLGIFAFKTIGNYSFIMESNFIEVSGVAKMINLAL